MWSVTMPSQEEIDHQQTLLATHRRTLAHYLKQQAALGEAYAPPVVSGGIREARANILRIKQILRGWKVSVDDQPDDGDAPLIAPTTEPSRQPISVDRVKLRNVLTEYFNDDELRDLCFELNIDYESLPGATKAGKARELVAYAERHGKYQDLVDQIRKLRTSISCKLMRVLYVWK
jgi:hypothetical protein